MNFFAHQKKAKTQSFWIIFAFIITVLLIVAVVNAIVLITISTETPSTFSVENISTHSPVLFLSSAITVSLILISSFIKAVGLHQGGGKIAKDLGGTIVPANINDPLRKRLYNVIEEIAIASGTPVPEVYVLENESTINAFAAGFTISDAAIAVTRGALENFTREELQGVIAHEFSHIFNGDMRINIRLISVISGIMVLAIVGRYFLSSGRYSTKREKNPLPIVGIALIAIGYIGVFFAKWMQSSLSRQREYLADATAIQFTRNPSGMSSVLKKIAIHHHQPMIAQNAETVSHMLFSSNFVSTFFATHPPILKRIQKIEPHFKEKDLMVLSKKAQENTTLHQQAALAKQEQKHKAKKTNTLFDLKSTIDNIGQPSIERVLAAAVLTQDIPLELISAARSIEWSPEVLLFCLLDEQEHIKQQQLALIKEKMGLLSREKVQQFSQDNPQFSHDVRLPLFEICFPNLKQRPLTDLIKIQQVIQSMILVDKKINTFEYLLSRLISFHLQATQQPNKVKLHGKLRINQCETELVILLSIVAMQGQALAKTTVSSREIKKAQICFSNAMNALSIKHTNISFDRNWQNQLDNTLQHLSALRLSEKKIVINALLVCIYSDKKVVSTEHELIRIICTMLHVPLPILGSKETLSHKK